MNSLTFEEIKKLWNEHKADPEGSVFTYTLSNGNEVEILVDWLKYANEYVEQVEKHAPQF